MVEFWCGSAKGEPAQIAGFVLTPWGLVNRKFLNGRRFSKQIVSPL
jgi:hypothetical protein